MLRPLAILPATAAAGLIAGAGTDTFLAAALAAVAAAWHAGRLRQAELCFATLDPLRPDPAVLPAALREALDRARHTRRAVRFRLAPVPPGACAPCSLTLTQEGDAAVCGLSRRAELRRPGIWLPDHPLPLSLTRNLSLTLVFEPCEGDRVRVSLPSAHVYSLAHGLTLALLAAAACALDAGWLLAAVLGFAFQAGLLQQQAGREPDDPEVRRR